MKTSHQLNTHQSSTSTKLWLILLASLATLSSGSAEVPESRRSRSVVARVKPKLEKELLSKGLSYGAPLFIRVFKESKELEVWLQNGKQFELFKTYAIHHFSGSLGPKLKEGDRQAPEGFYFVTPDRMNPNSRFHLSFNLGYPNAYDQAHGRTGSALMVHGSTVSIGCYAMTDERIEEIYTLADAALRNGQKFFRVHCFPFRMNDEAMAKNKGHTWHSFWLNLKEGYDFFEKTRNPPDVEVKNKRYMF